MLTIDFWPCILLLFFVFNSSAATSSRLKRQSGYPLDDIISSALSLVRPIFDPGQPQDGGLIPRKVSMNDDSGIRAAEVLGAPRWSSLQEVPLCRGNSKICHFIACSAANFKHDEGLANLNLAAQTIGDPKLRKTISANPEAIGTVCRDQGLSEGQCRLFARGFQLIDRFMNTIEKPPADDAPILASSSNAVADDPLVDRSPPHMVNLAAPQSISSGSHTWSARRVVESGRSTKRVRHTTSQRTDPLGMTSSPTSAHDLPPRARRPHLSKTTVASRPKRPPPESIDYEEEVEEVPRRPRRSKRPRRSTEPDYYDELHQDPSSVSSSSPTANSKRPPPTNCMSLLR